jgi:prefoldin subunit 5
MYIDRRLEQLLAQLATLERALASLERRFKIAEQRLGEIQRAGGNAGDSGDASD